MNPRVVVVAHVLLPAGLDRLKARYEVSAGRLDPDAGPSCWRRSLAAAAVVVDPSVPIDGEVLDAAGDGLKVLANFAVGYDNVDLDACRKRGVIVTNTPDVLTEATAELAMALTLAAARRMSDAERDLRAGRWGGWVADSTASELRDSTVGVVGMGRIGIATRGSRMARRQGRLHQPVGQARRGGGLGATPPRAAATCSKPPTWSASTPPRRLRRGD